MARHTYHNLRAGSGEALVCWTPIGTLTAAADQKPREALWFSENHQFALYEGQVVLRYDILRA